MKCTVFLDTSELGRLVREEIYRRLPSPKITKLAFVIEGDEQPLLTGAEVEVEFGQ